MKNVSRLLSIILLITTFSLAREARGNESALSMAFMKAYNTNIGMKEIIENNIDLVPKEIKTLLEQSHGKDIPAELKAQKQYIAESMARAYKNVTGENTYFIEVKREILNSRLHDPVRREATKGTHIIEAPHAAANEKNVFKPDNIVIRAGETIRWVNKASLPQKLTSMPLIGEQVAFTPSIEPDETWEHHFDEAGEYYYFDYNHRSMVGKITVLPAKNDNVSVNKETTGEKR